MATLVETITDLNNNSKSLLDKYETILKNLPVVVSTEIGKKSSIAAEGTIEEFKLVENGKVLNYSTDEIDASLINEGYELFCPHSRDEYEKARKYLVSIGKPKSMGPLGIYYPSNGPGCRYRSWFSCIPLNSSHMGKKGWKVKDGNHTWWASDKTNVTEPNGDYKANAYLGISYDNNGNVYWYNDANNNYKYSTYLCVKRFKK